MIDAVRVALTATRSNGPPRPGDLAVIELRDARGVLLGVDELGRPHLLLEAGADIATPRVREVATLEVGDRILVLNGREHRFIDVTCLFQSVADVFEHFVVAVAERIVAGDGAAAALISVLSKWRQFLVPAERSLRPGKLAATFGELLVLRDIVRADSTGVDAWVAPFGGRHDFRRGDVAIEVKTTRANSSYDVTIHGEEQLDLPVGGSLFLHFVRLEDTPHAGESVAAVVDDILSSGVAAETLFEALTAAGVPVSELAATADISFQVRERLTLPVDEAMPRVVPASFVDGSRPSGVLAISYTIGLSDIVDRALTTSGYQELVRSLGDAAS